MTDLGTLGGKESHAIAINNHGQIVGYSTTKNGSKHAVLWTLKGSVRNFV
jgi:probable HAF family extracellular repeat protein